MHERLRCGAPIITPSAAFADADHFTTSHYCVFPPAPEDPLNSAKRRPTACLLQGKAIAFEEAGAARYAYAVSKNAGICPTQGNTAMKEALLSGFVYGILSNAG